MISKNNWRLLKRLTWRDRLLVGETIFVLAIARIVILIFPFRWLVAFSKRLFFQPRKDLDFVQRKANRIGQAIRYFSPQLPWRALCLEQAIAGAVMLGWRQIPSIVSIGVKRDGEDFKAHAWLKYGETVLTGDDGLETYTHLSDFGMALE